jgi:DNA-binding NarL/FixJ family response regulator
VDAVTTAEPVRVLLVDDDALVRAGLTMMLEAFEGIQVAAAVADGTEVAAAVDRHHPDVVLMDIRMPGMDGLTATESLRARREPPEVIVLTTFDTDAHVLRAMRAGASGFLLKHTPPAQIVEAIHKVADGDHMLSPSVTAQLIARLGDDEADTERDTRAQSRFETLSAREREVAVAVGQGKANAQIAAELYMSVATVKAHVSRIMVKLEAANRVQVALRVHDLGLL